MNVTECDIGDEHYWIASMGLGSKLATGLLDVAMSEGRTPLRMGSLVVEMIDTCEEWCLENCNGRYQIDPAYRLEVWFTDPKDAMLFKLTYG